MSRQVFRSVSWNYNEGKKKRFFTTRERKSRAREISHIRWELKAQIIAFECNSKVNPSWEKKFRKQKSVDVFGSENFPQQKSAKSRFRAAREPTQHCKCGLLPCDGIKFLSTVAVVLFDIPFHFTILQITAATPYKYENYFKALQTNGKLCNLGYLNRVHLVTASRNFHQAMDGINISEYQ